MGKSPDAFRTISEVAEWLGVQAHVLRFWESKFTQVKPIKRAGGRRYYRPADMLLLGGIKQLLHEDGLTIKGVQKILREEGMSHVSSLSAPLDEATLEGAAAIDAVPAAPMSVDAEEERGVVLSFDARDTRPPEEAPPAIAEQPAGEPSPEPSTPLTAPPPPNPEASREPTVPATSEQVDRVDAAPDTPEPAEEETPPKLPETPAEEPPSEPLVPDEPPTPDEPPSPEVPEEKSATAPMSEAPTPAERPEPLTAEHDPVAAEPEGQAEPAPSEASDAATVAEEPASPLPAFLRRPLDDTASAERDNGPEEPAAAEPVERPEVDVRPEEITGAPEPEPEPETVQATPEPAPEPERKPRRINVAPFTPEGDFDATPGPLTAAYRLRTLRKPQANEMGPLLDRLTQLRDRMSANRQQPGGQG
ncbi:MAG: MerR family transcriptional regulator [Sulfitobacter sp.]|nr:MerR family transcriptional regulator [Sulfitobacter sp.]